jgi:hypothetical protein
LQPVVGKPRPKLANVMPETTLAFGGGGLIAASMKLPLLALALLLCPAPAWAEEKPAKPKPPLPVAHQSRQIEGWTVRIDERLLSGPDAELGERVLKALSARLVAIDLVLAGEPLTKLREVPIQLDLTHGDLRAAQYHPSAGWLKSNGYSEALAKCVHIPDAARLLSRFDNHRMPWVILHELAHAYHDRVLGFENPRIAAVWEKFKANSGDGLVLMSNGQRRRHYGLTNAKEFFAEMTEAYLGSNDFFPFVAGEMKESQPETFALMAEIWGPLPKD